MLQSQRNFGMCAAKAIPKTENPAEKTYGAWDEETLAEKMAALANSERESRRKKSGIDKTGTQHARVTIAAKRRVQVLECVRKNGPIRTADICKRLYLSCFSTVSSDLGIMREDGIVDFYRDGPNAFWVASDV